MENHTIFARSADVQVTAKLTIQDFVEVMKTSKPAKYYISDNFMVGATPMAIQVYPNGQKYEFKGNVSVFLWNQSDADITVKCQFVTDAKTDDHNNEVVKAKEGFGTFNFLYHAQCKDAFKERDFVLTANVEIPGEELKIMGNEDAVVPKKHCVCKNLFDQMMDPNFSLVFQGAEVPCHQLPSWSWGSSILFKS